MKVILILLCFVKFGNFILTNDAIVTADEFSASADFS